MKKKEKEAWNLLSAPAWAREGGVLGTGSGEKGTGTGAPEVLFSEASGGKWLVPRGPFPSTGPCSNPAGSGTGGFCPCLLHRRAPRSLSYCIDLEQITE